MADQLTAPDATTRRASVTVTLAVGRVAWTTNANGIRYWGEGFGAAGDRDGLDGLDQGAAGVDTGVLTDSVPDAWQPASNTTTRAAEPAHALIRPA
jgi:hypothetical protein